MEDYTDYDVYCDAYEAESAYDDYWDTYEAHQAHSDHYESRSAIYTDDDCDYHYPANYQ